MTRDAYVFGDLSWPMPDPGLVAVWRAMSLDPSRWDDWDGFVDGGPAGTIAEFVDKVGKSSAGPFELEMGEHGVRLRAYLAESHAELWQRLAVAWRLAADIGASGQFTWIGETGPAAVAYRAVIADFSSRWEKLTGKSATEAEALPGRREIDALVEKRGPRPRAATVRAKTADPSPRAKTADPLPRAKTADPMPAVAAASAKPAKKAAAKKPAPAARPAKKSAGKKR